MHSHSIMNPMPQVCVRRAAREGRGSERRGADAGIAVMAMTEWAICLRQYQKSRQSGGPFQIRFLLFNPLTIRKVISETAIITAATGAE